DAKVLEREQKSLWIGIDRGGEGKAVYSLGPGKDEPPARRGDQQIDTQQRLLLRLDAVLAMGGAGKPAVWVKAHPELPYSAVQALLAELQKRRDKIGRINISVTKPPFYHLKKLPEDRKEPKKDNTRPIRVKVSQVKDAVKISVEGKEVSE